MYSQQRFGTRVVSLIIKKSCTDSPSFTSSQLRLLLCPMGNTTHPSSTGRYKAKHSLHAIHWAGRKSMILSEKTTLIINPANWNTPQNHCYKSSIYTKSGGWSSGDCRERKHDSLPGREAQSHLDSPSSHLIQCGILENCNQAG